MSEAKEESLKTSKRKTTCAEDTHKPRSRFLDRNFAGQKGAAWNIQSAERKILQLRILYLEKLSLRIEGERKKKAEKDDHF